MATKATSVAVKFLSAIVAVVWKLTSGMRTEPSFATTPENVTAFSGQNAVLPCTVNHLGKYKVVWLDQNSFPLTFDERRVIDDLRFSVVRPYIRDWNLMIRGVRPGDTGQYTCTVNTEPVLSKLINFDVKVSPRFLDQSTNQLVVAQEGDTVVLACNVTGKPEPEVTWQRRVVSGGKASYAVESLATLGPQLVIKNASRNSSYFHFVYECLANNGIPPAVNRQIRLAVHYAPDVAVTVRPSRLRLGHAAELECSAAAFPVVDDVFWERRRQQLASTNDGRKVVERVDDGGGGGGGAPVDGGGVVVTLRLLIRALGAVDFGDYACVASNSVGTRRKSVTIVEHMVSEGQHQATPSKRESALQAMTSERLSLPTPGDVRRDSNKMSPSRLTVSEKSLASDRRRGRHPAILMCCFARLLTAYL